MAMHEKEQMKRDVALGDAVVAELDWHALIDATQLAVTVENNVVTIIGTVPSMAEKLVVIDTVESVGGVHDVISEIDVKLPTDSGRTDQTLHTIVDQTLAWNALVPEDELTHEIVDGWITLRGTVPTARQRVEAERLVSHILGVRGVTNEIELAEVLLDPATVRTAIVSALERHAKHEANHIDVVVEGNRVSLSGTVESPSEKRAVIGAASHAPGVEALCADLVVRPRVFDDTALIG